MYLASYYHAGDILRRWPFRGPVAQTDAVADAAVDAHVGRRSDAAVRRRPDDETFQSHRKDSPFRRIRRLESAWQADVIWLMEDLWVEKG